MNWDSDDLWTGILIDLIVIGLVMLGVAIGSDAFGVKL